MKKMLFSLVLALVALRGFSQNMDSLAVVQEVDSLIQISRTFTSKGDFGKALEINAAAEKLAIEKLGRETVVYGNACYNHASILYYKDDYPEAEKWYMESKVIREKTLGKKHPDYANSLTGLATMYLRLSNFVKAEPLCLEAKNILENAPDRKPLDYAASLHNLAWLYHEMGNLEKAEPLYLESIALREKVLGKDPADLDLGWSLNNLANVYWQMGDYEKAEQLHLGTITIRAKVLGKESILYIVSLINLASLYLDIGNYRKAEQLYLEAKNIFEVGLKNREHFFYILCLNNMANLYTLMGDVEKAEQLYLEAKRIWEATLNSNNSPQYAKNLLSLASLASKKRNYEKAESLTLEAKAIWENKLGKEHPDYAMSLFGLANIYTAMGNYEKAESLYLETKGILEKTAGKENTKYAACLEALTNLYWVTGNLVAAKAFLMETNASERKRFTKASRHLSERELSSYLAKFKYGANSAFSFAQTHSDLFNTCYDNTLFHKGFLLNAVSQIRRLALTDSISTEKYYLLKACNRLLSAEYAKPISKRKKVSELEEQANTLEKELAHHVSGLGEAIRQVNWQEVHAKLKPEEVAIEFVHYRFVSPKSTRPNIYYAALLLRSGETQSLFLPLFEEKQLDSLLQTHNERKADYVNNLYTHTKRGIVRTDKPAKSIYQLIWQPIDSLLNSPAAERRRGEAVKTIYFSPSGLLHRLNLAAIPIGHDSVLADRYQLVQFGSTRQIVIQNQTTVASNTAVLFGGIRYDVDTTAIQKPSADWNMSDAAAGSRGNFSFAYSDTVFRGGVWDYLPFTEKEVASIEKTLKSGGAHTQTLTGNAATEAFLKSVGHGKSSPRTLHIATHGFFFPDPKDTTYRSAPAFGGSWGETESIFKTADNPLMRSGLILAGANQTWSGGKTPEGQEDGILTAYEISQMNLSNTELVVLSACETGLGDIQGNEGVYGLQRAFKIAGAKYLIMSLWQVPDKQTSLLMTTFYKKWLEEKMEIPEAFRAAQKEMREQSLDPYQWAGFVLVE